MEEEGGVWKKRVSEEGGKGEGGRQGKQQKRWDKSHQVNAAPC